MARVTVYTAERMQTIENTTVIDGHINEGGDLILHRRDGYTINAGKVGGPKGDGGAGVSRVDVSYQASSSPTNEPTGDWKDTIPLVPDGWYLWTKTITTYEDPSNPENTFKTVTYGVMKNSLPGADGTGIVSAYTDYQVGNTGVDIPDGKWLPGVPTVAPGKFLWTRTTTTYSDQTKNIAYSVAKQGTDGQNGTPADNNYLHVAYANSDDGLVDFSTSNPSGRSYMGIAETEDKQDPSDPGMYAWSLIKGTNGVGISSSKVMYQSSSSGTETPTGTWTDDIPVVAPGMFLWTRTAINFTDGASKTIYSVALQGVPGEDGRGITSVTEEYYLSTSQTTLVGGTWSATRPPWVAGKFYWTRSVVNYTSGNPTTTDPICVTGTDGRSVVDVDVMYYSSTSSEQPIGGTWGTESLPWVAGRYIWTRTVTTYTTGDPTTTAPICVTGAKGDPGENGNGIETISVRYQGSVYGSKAPEGVWSETIPTVPDGHYLWTRTITKLTDGTTTTAYSVAKQGEVGKPGEPGTDGRSVVLIFPTYQVGDSGAIEPVGEWLEEVPEVPDGKYLWTRLTTTYSIGTPTHAYTVGKMGEAGPPKPLYMWVRYADDAEGGGIAKEPDGKSYMGIAANQQTPQESDDPEDYVWSLIAGIGPDGRGIAETLLLYKLSVGWPQLPPSVESAMADGWVPQEPAYVAGDANNLYTILVTIFDNDEVAISTFMQLSSSYHAAKAAYSLAEGLYQVIPSKTEPTESPAGALKAGDQWWVIGEGEQDGQFISVKVYDGFQWVLRKIYADSIMALNSISSKLIDAEELWASQAWIDVLSAGLIKVDYLEPNYGPMLNLWANEAVEIIVGRQDEQEAHIAQVEETATTAAETAENNAALTEEAAQAAAVAYAAAEIAKAQADGNAEKMTKHQAVFRVTQTGAEIASKDSSNMVRINPTGVSIIQGGAAVSTWDSGRLIVGEAVVARAKIGSHVLEKATGSGRTIIRPI